MSLIHACLICLFLISSNVSAKSVMLKTTIVSVSSEHGILQAEVHFDERDAEIASKVEKIIRTDLIKVINYFEYIPRDIVHFNVDPYMRVANGNARVFTSNVINIYNFPASNNDHLIVLEDWLKGLVFHEYIHITHLDQTRGWMDDGRKIFGTIAKLPANIVPRWFTEGIAVWGESHLIEGGRLSNKLFRKELLVQFLQTDFCKTIDCLDDPGVYPKGQLAYWAGSQFLEYIENLKAGSIHCLVVENSSAIPFLLNRAFTSCTGKTAQDHFTDFREKLIGKASTENVWGEKINNGFGSDYFQKGIVLDGDMLYKVEANRYTEALMSYDLTEASGLSLIKQVYHDPIEDLAGIVSGTSSEGEPIKYLVMSFNEDPQFRKENKKWTLVNAETLLIEKKLQFRNDPSYVVALGNNRYLTASYIDNHWIIEKQRMNDEVLLESDVLYSFAGQYNLVQMKKLGEKILLKINDEEKSHLLISDTTLQSLNIIFSSAAYFEVPLATENFLVIDEKGNQTIIEVDPSFEKANYTAVKKDALKNVTFAEMNDSRILVLENTLKTKSMSLKDGLALLKNGQPGEKKTLAMLESPKSSFDKSQLKTENYPQLYHLSPNFWFLATGTGENIGSIGATTTINDPMLEHFINITGLVYPEVSKVGGTFEWIHRIMSISDLWSVNAFFNQDYSKSEFNDSLMDSMDVSLGTAYRFLMRKWTYTPGIYVAGSKDKDFISNRSVNSLGVRQTLTYQALQFEDLLQSIFFHVKTQNDYANVGDKYFNLYTKFYLLARFTDRLEGGIQTAFGKLYKDDFNRGVLYGGGINTVATLRNFEFYGIPYSNAFGNEIFTFRLFGDYNFWNIYRSKNMLPIFFREAHLLFGAETMSADRIFLDNKVFRNETVQSVFGGVRLETDLFYYVPANIDFILSSTKRPDGKNSGAANFLINAELF
jgi:hypothetical protein